MKHHPSLLPSSRRPSPLHRRISAIVLPMLAMIGPAAGQAQTSTWINAAGGGLEVGGSWAGGTVPANAAGAVWDFSTLDIAAATTVSLNGARTAGSLVFG